MNDLIVQQSIILIYSALKEILQLHKRNKKCYFSCIFFNENLQA
jgi:hypothetical protein